MSGRVDVALWGPTGLVGQELARRLAGHPWFRLKTLIGSSRSAGRRYGDAVETGASLPVRIRDMVIESSGTEPGGAPIAFSALSAGAARELEPYIRARGGTVFTNASPHRFGDGRTPVIPEVNPGRLRALFASTTPDRPPIIPNPNCVVAGLAPVLAALHDAFGIRAVTVTTLQALSGAGRRGIAALGGPGNVIPDIPGEARKIARETRAIVGLEVPMSIDVHRVPVRVGHVASVRARTDSRPTPADVARAVGAFRGREPLPPLPSAPDRPIRVHDGAERPQPALDVHDGGGMTISVGRIGRDESYDITLSLLVHNTIRGAAGGSLLNAELALALGLLRDRDGSPLRAPWGSGTTGRASASRPRPGGVGGMGVETEP